MTGRQIVYPNGLRHCFRGVDHPYADFNQFELTE